MYQCYYNVEKELVLSHDIIKQNRSKLLMFNECCIKPCEEHREQFKEDVEIISILDNISAIFCESLFSDFINLKYINNIERLNFKNCLSSQHMFRNCKSIEKLDLSKCNFSKVRKTYHMFESCSNLKELILPETFPFLTREMFIDCEKLEKICWNNHIYTSDDIREYEEISK